jgi:Flp pilus assembly protein TadD
MLLPGVVYRLLGPRAQWQTMYQARTLVLLMVPAVLIFYSAKTVARNTVWEDELTFWSAAVYDSPGSTVARNNLGIVYARTGKDHMAIREFKKAVALTGHEGLMMGRYNTMRRDKLFNNLGKSYYQLLQKRLAFEEHATLRAAADEIDAERIDNDTRMLYTLSRTWYQKALGINPANAETHNNLGDLFYVMKNYSAAEEEYSIALKHCQDNAHYYNNLGLAYYGMKNYDGAEEMLSKAISLQPDYLDARNNLALIYLHRGMYTKAREELERVLSGSPDNSGVYFNLALLYLRGFHDRERALFYLKEGLKASSCL